MNHKSLSNKALFLDRDGVINANHGYVSRIEEIDFLPGIFDLTKSAQNKGYQIIIVTNQSGIARHFYSAAQFHFLSRWIQHQFWQRGIKIRKTFHCPHHPSFSHRCSCRKPRIGMITKATRLFDIDLKKSIMIGDSLSDIACARSAGIGKAIYLNPTLNTFSGKLIKPSYKPYFQARNLKSITKLL